MFRKIDVQIRIRIAIHKHQLPTASTPKEPNALTLPRISILQTLKGFIWFLVDWYSVEGIFQFFFFFAIIRRRLKEVHAFFKLKKNLGPWEEIFGYFIASNSVAFLAELKFEHTRNHFFPYLFSFLLHSRVNQLHFWMNVIRHLHQVPYNEAYQAADRPNQLLELERNAEQMGTETKQTAASDIPPGPTDSRPFPSFPIVANKNRRSMNWGKLVTGTHAAHGKPWDNVGGAKSNTKIEKRLLRRATYFCSTLSQFVSPLNPTINLLSIFQRNVLHATH